MLLFYIMPGRWWFELLKLIICGKFIVFKQNLSGIWGLLWNCGVMQSSKVNTIVFMVSVWYYGNLVIVHYGKRVLVIGKTLLWWITAVNREGGFSTLFIEWTNRESVNSTYVIKLSNKFETVLWLAQHLPNLLVLAPSHGICVVFAWDYIGIRNNMVAMNLQTPT